MGSARMTFEGDEFAGFNEAEKFAAECGFSVGRMQRDEPIGLMFGDCDIAKWRDLSGADIDALHGIITGQKRRGPVHVTIFATAPQEAWERWRAAVSARGVDVTAA